MFQDTDNTQELLRFMKRIKVSRSGLLSRQDKGQALCVGAHGAGNNSQCDCVLEMYEK